MEFIVYNTKAEAVDRFDLDVLLDLSKTSLHSHLVSKYVYGYLSIQRQGNAKTKDRSEVSGGGRKPYRQKGTGRARAGSIRSPLWRGGGVTFGPNGNVNFKKKINKKERAQVFVSAFFNILNSGNFRVIDSYDGILPSTKSAIEFLNAFNVNKKVLVLTFNKNENLLKAFSNLENVIVKPVTEVSPYDLLCVNFLFIEKRALEYVNVLIK